jgi:hypothetical protein
MASITQYYSYGANPGVLGRGYIPGMFGAYAAEYTFAKALVLGAWLRGTLYWISGTPFSRHPVCLQFLSHLQGVSCHLANDAR